ncbi:hypothetical protein SPRG_04358 [Saprolegnia parasitica CBS 223.65]|uniref:Uncharacterized protein n=1 Tax=Saprolegnia parasitica (strain CBS 223.65) TaxID=695850 RepID=A0A067CV92_SAPPC|nr:hypothetical protein SPRG_04358 [Saprolegnia parasitica CBS 223.65]KDO30456.1 hypothetical protein SPRG_04358 [Saprolegnia parasitica CBS 223.65]|eukprot:XP_012198678.1 hypothetical protein SPRG_04358 [Saprolegnia parasitica CBS 223.65]
MSSVFRHAARQWRRTVHANGRRLTTDATADAKEFYGRKQHCQPYWDHSRHHGGGAIFAIATFAGGYCIGSSSSSSIDPGRCDWQQELRDDNRELKRRLDDLQRLAMRSNATAIAAP